MSDPDAHLLIVDDDERIRGLLQKFLMRHGFLVQMQVRQVLHNQTFLLMEFTITMFGQSQLIQTLIRLHL